MAKQAKPKFVNPFDEGVTYEDFLKSLPTNKSVSEHLKGKCSTEQIEWIESELKHLTNK